MESERTPSTDESLAGAFENWRTELMYDLEVFETSEEGVQAAESEGKGSDVDSPWSKRLLACTRRIQALSEEFVSLSTSSVRGSIEDLLSLQEQKEWNQKFID